MSKRVPKCTKCKKNPQWDDVTGLCESCYDELCKESHSIPAFPLSAKTWNAIVSTLSK